VAVESKAGGPVDVVVPVFGEVLAVRRCLESVLRSDRSALGRLLVIDDASPDRETRAYLDGLSGAQAIELTRHERNRGFVATANAGMLASAADVILLNSDTEVHGDWIRRMQRCAYRNERVATVTPFSNHATICSYPWLGWSGGVPGELSVAELDTMFAQANAACSAELPTGVGFCLLIRRACIDEVGVFDEARFGRGYGEENDFCQRAVRAGWRNMLCADTFVFHEGGASFGAERQARCDEAERVLAALHPEYPGRVRQFILADPLREYRQGVDLARMLRNPEQARAVLEERAAEKVWLLGWLGHVVRQADMKPPEMGEGQGRAEADGRPKRNRGWKDVLGSALFGWKR